MSVQNSTCFVFEQLFYGDDVFTVLPKLCTRGNNIIYHIYQSSSTAQHKQAGGKKIATTSYIFYIYEVMSQTAALHDVIKPVSR